MISPPTIEVLHTPEQCLVILRGELDMAAQDEIYRNLVQALAACPDDAPAIVIDLSGVTFLDSSGLGALVEIRRQAVERGQTTTLRNPNPRVLRVLQIARIDSLFPVELH